jgi:AcrR family transcriptional regulator
MPTKGGEKIQDSTKYDLILEAARSLFAEKGYESTTIADIALKAGIAVGTVYLYFHNKHEIYTAVGLYVKALVANTFQNPQLLSLPFDQLLDAMVDALFKMSHEHMTFMTFLQIDTYSCDEVEQHKRSHGQISDSLATIFEHAIARGDLAPFDTQMYAQMLTLMGSSIIHQCFALERGERENIFRAYLKEFLQRLFLGPSLREGIPEARQSEWQLPR